MAIKSFWQTWFGRCIFKSGNIHVYQNPFFRWLTFDSPLTQTLINRKHPERPVLKYIDALLLGLRLKEGAIVLFGLGGGAVVHTLHAKIKTLNTPTCRGLSAASKVTMDPADNPRDVEHGGRDVEHTLDIVEISPQMIQVARHYFGIDTLPAYPIHCKDAAVFIKTANNLQHILLDVYQAHDYPKQCLTESFFQDCYDALNPDGILAINNPDPKLQTIIITILRKIFNTIPMSIPIDKTTNQVILIAKSIKPGWLINTIINN